MADRVKNADGDAAQIDRTSHATNAYPSKSDKKTKRQHLVFRSYANPEATDAEGELTELKVVFANTVKTGKPDHKQDQHREGEH